MKDRKARYTRRGQFASFLCFFVMAACLGIFRPMGNVDEIWNYTFGNNMASGLVPYRDFNLLQTPAFAAIHGLALNLFGRELLVTRLLGAFLFAGICQLLYLFSARLGARGAVRWILPGTFLILFDYNVFFEYSCLILFCMLVCLYVDLCEAKDLGKMSFNRKERRYGQWYVQMAVGFMGGLAVMSKQTFGGFVALASWIAVVWVSRMRRDDKKETVRLLFFRMLGSSIPCFAVLFYLLSTGSWGDFLEMSVFGISTFTSSLNFVEYVTEKPKYAVYGAVSVVILIYDLFYVFWLRRETEGKMGGLVLLYGILGCINLYPLCNTYHLCTNLIPFLLLLIPPLAWLGQWLVPRLASLAIVLGMLVYIFVWYPRDCLKDGVWVTDIPHFRGIFMYKDEIDGYRKVLAGIQGWLDAGWEVYILDNRAPFYLIPVDKYHKYTDMFLVGNLGLKTPAECLEETLEKSENAAYLVPEDMNGQYQYPEQAILDFTRRYLLNNGGLSEFICYEWSKERGDELPVN